MPVIIVKPIAPIEPGLFSSPGVIIEDVLQP